MEFYITNEDANILKLLLNNELKTIEIALNKQQINNENQLISYDYFKKVNDLLDKLLKNDNTSYEVEHE